MAMILTPPRKTGVKRKSGLVARQISKPISESITTSPKIVDRRTGRDVTAKVTGQTSGRARKRRMVTR